jgi:hypothetical protein
MKANYFKNLIVGTAIFMARTISSQCVAPPTPTITGTGGCGTSFPITSTLSATGASSLQTGWYANSFGGNAVGTGSTYATPSLTSATVYYAAQLSATGTASLSMPPHGSNFSGNVRGYWFTAPASFVITGVRVPTDASSGNSNIAIVKFQGNVPPPLFSATTNSFDVLYLTQNNTSGTGTISVNIPVYSGDVIGVLGERGGINSYAPAPSNQTLGSFSVTLNRMGMQFPLSTNPPQQLWSEASGSISRVELYTTLGCLNALTAYTVDVLPSPTVTAVSSTSAICANSSATLTASGASTYSWNTTATTTAVSVSPSVTTVYSVVGTATNGCTSTATVNVNVNPSPTLTIAGPTAVCAGSSTTITASGANTYTWNTNANTAAIVVTPTANTTYTAMGTGTNGCVGMTTKVIQFNALPTLTFTAAQSTVCVNSGTYALNGLPSGGVYSGSNVSGSAFNSGSVAATFNPVYSFTSAATGCSNTASTSIVVSGCVGLNEVNSTSTSFNVYPNPNNGAFTLQFSNTGVKTISIMDVTGRVVASASQEAREALIDITHLANGVYYAQVTSNGTVETVKIIKQ